MCPRIPSSNILWHRKEAFSCFLESSRTSHPRFSRPSKAKVMEEVWKTNRISFRSEVSTLPDFPSFISSREASADSRRSQRALCATALCNSQFYLSQEKINLFNTTKSSSKTDSDSRIDKKARKTFSFLSQRENCQKSESDLFSDVL